MQGDVWAILASGPSLGWDDYADVELIRQSGIKTIAINNTWQVAPWCDVIYAGDSSWWKHHHKTIPDSAARWSCSRSADSLFGATARLYRGKNGFNSGANAIELAANHYRAGVVILLGFDCSLAHGIHHHGPHKKTANPRPERMEKWHRQFVHLRGQIGKTRVINCSRFTALDMFSRSDLKETLCELGLTCGTPRISGQPYLNAALPSAVMSQSTA